LFVVFLGLFNDTNLVKIWNNQLFIMFHVLVFFFLKNQA
jgi:hypothetical protein